MLTATALKHFGGNLSALARAAGCTRQAVQQWGKYVPEYTAWKLHKLHDGLAFNEDHYAQGELVRRQRIARTMKAHLKAHPRKRKLQAPRRADATDEKPPGRSPTSGA